MKLDRISFQELIPTGSFSNNRMTVEAQLEEGDNPSECMDKLRDFVDAKHREYFPQYYQASTTENASNTLPYKVSDPKESAIQSHIKTINECKTLNNLKIFEKLVQNADNEELTAAWNLKLNQLSNG